MYSTLKEIDRESNLVFIRRRHQPFDCCTPHLRHQLRHLPRRHHFVAASTPCWRSSRGVHVRSWTRTGEQSSLRRSAVTNIILHCVLSVSARPRLNGASLDKSFWESESSRCFSVEQSKSCNKIWFVQPNVSHSSRQFLNFSFKWNPT